MAMKTLTWMAAATAMVTACASEDKNRRAEVGAGAGGAIEEPARGALHIALAK
jgi:hypothetical protein